MKKKIGIITINDDNNYGNRLQNYAVQTFLEKNDIETKTIRNSDVINNKENNHVKYKLKFIKKQLGKYKKILKIKRGREKYFYDFDRNIKYTKNYFNAESRKIYKKYDYFITGSDQVWNPTFKRLSDFDLLTFAKPEQRIAFSASFGINELPECCKEKAKNELQKFKAISVREERGKEIVKDLTKRTDIHVIVDPTMLLTTEEWGRVAKKPKQLQADRYILNYFLGNLTEKRKKEIESVAKENNCKVINILDKKDLFYQSGPSEFLYLEKNAFLICTDSFHSCVFAILFNIPFIIFDREDANAKMNSRLDTLLRKFNLKNRWFEDKIKKEQLQIDYTETYKILEKERGKAKKFIKDAIV